MPVVTDRSGKDPIKTDCRTDYHAVRNSGRRKLDDIWWIVMHDEEGATAAGAASYFAATHGGNPQGSAHLCVDDVVCYRTLANEEIPWGAASAIRANTHGFHIEQAGFARWSTVIWMSHWRTLQRAAYKAAYHCSLFKIPPVFVNAEELLFGKHGITTHAEVTKASKLIDPAFAFKYTHTDPGVFWPRRAFMVLVRRYYAQLVGV